PARSVRAPGQHPVLGGRDGQRERAARRYRDRIELPRRGRRDDLRGLRPLAITTGVSLAILAVMTALIGLQATVAPDLAVTQALQSQPSLPLDILANAHTLIVHAHASSVLAALLAIILWRR